MFDCIHSINMSETTVFDAGLPIDTKQASAYYG